MEPIAVQRNGAANRCTDLLTPGFKEIFLCCEEPEGKEVYPNNISNYEIPCSYCASLPYNDNKPTPFRGWAYCITYERK